MDKETTFENAKVGDKVWSPIFGEGIVKEMLPLCFFLSIKVIDYNGRAYDFSLDGQKTIHGPQCLFWSKQNIVAPSKPSKHKLVIRITDWVKHDGVVLPHTKDICFDTDGFLYSDFRNLEGKGPMLMTLEWEEQ
jgi:hypothetical protein